MKSDEKLRKPFGIKLPQELLTRIDNHVEENTPKYASRTHFIEVAITSLLLSDELDMQQLAEKIYEKLKEKGTGIGNASIPIIKSVLKSDKVF